MWALTCGDRGLAATRYARTAATFHAGMLSLGRGLEDRPCRRGSRLPAPTLEARDQVCAETVPSGRCDGLCVARTSLTTGCDRPCGDNSRSGMDARARPFMRDAARAFPVGAGERRVCPDSGDSRRLPRPPMRPRPYQARLIMRTTRHPFSQGGDGRARPPMRTYPSRSG